MMLNLNSIYKIVFIKTNVTPKPDAKKNLTQSRKVAKKNHKKTLRFCVFAWDLALNTIFIDGLGVTNKLRKNNAKRI